MEELPHERPDGSIGFFYPVDCAYNHALRQQALVIAPFVKCVWISRPPVFIKTDDDGHLHCIDGPAAKFSDGYEILAKQQPKPLLEDASDAEYLPDPDVLALPAPEENL